MLKTAFVYGLISGALALGVILAGMVFSVGHHGTSSLWFGYLVMIVALSTIFLAIRDYRNKSQGGVIKFLPAFGLGLMIAAFAGVVYVVSWEAYLAATHYSFMDEYTAAILARARAAGMTGAALQQKIAELSAMKAQYANPLFRLPMTFLEIFPVGFLIALFSAAILRFPKVLPARASV
jgi:hypothetical protein